MICEDCVYSDIADWEQDEKQESQRLCIGAKDTKSCARIYMIVNLEKVRRRNDRSK